METVRIKRVDSSDQGTFGILEAKGKRFFTGELPDRGNQPNISCIPPGRYQAVFGFSPRFKRKMYGIVPVPGRSGIRKHSANLMGALDKGFKAQLNGCVSLGLRLGFIDGQKALLLSAPAIRQFESLMEGKPFELEIQ